MHTDVDRFRFERRTPMRLVPKALLFGLFVHEVDARKRLWRRPDPSHDRRVKDVSRRLLLYLDLRCDDGVMVLWFRLRSFL